uniref:Protein alan shepard n=1 Tax=Cacopsylla melanoneura TaxID=428564 RepID=A0A8D8VU39_9HEMI
MTPHATPLMSARISFTAAVRRSNYRHWAVFPPTPTRIGSPKKAQRTVSHYFLFPSFPLFPLSLCFSSDTSVDVSQNHFKRTNLYVSKLASTITDDQLEQMFSPFGRIVKSTIWKDKVNDMGTGVGFVRYAREDDAQNAISALNGTIPMGCTSPIGVKIAKKQGK